MTTGNERTLKTGSQAGDLIDGWFTSPDGKQVAYPVVRGGQTELRIMNTDGSGDRALIPMQTVEIGIAAWSWDGRFLLYDSDYAGERARVINVATGESWDLLRDWPSWDSEASRAPDGSFVAVTTSDSRTRWELLRGVTYEAVARLMKK